MKLKLVVASMSALALLSNPAFAVPQTKHTHHKKIHKTSHHVVVKNDYQEIVALPIQPAPVTLETEPRIDTYQTILDGMDHNTSRAKPMPDWFNRIGISGGTNVDLKWGNRRPIYRTENINRIALNDVYVNFSGVANDWAKAFGSLEFSNPSQNYSRVYQPINSVTLEQGFVTLGNFDVYPLFLQVGKKFQDFGRYTIHPLNRTLAQSLSESLRTSANLGFITKMGLHGSVYAFRNTLTVANQSHPKTVYGASIGFDHPNDQLGYDVGLGYLSNMAGVNDVATVFVNPDFARTPYSPVHNVGAIAVYADVNSGPFSLGARYTTSIQTFNPLDISSNTVCSQEENALVGCTFWHAGTGAGARLWAADLTAGYGFNAMSKNQNIYLGYQASGNAVNLALPRDRILAGYGIDMWKNTNLGLEYTRDYAYGSDKGGPGGATNTVGVRGAVKFG